MGEEIQAYPITHEVNGLDFFGYRREGGTLSPTVLVLSPREGSRLSGYIMTRQNLRLWAARLTVEEIPRERISGELSISILEGHIAFITEYTPNRLHLSNILCIILALKSIQGIDEVWVNLGEQSKIYPSIRRGMRPDLVEAGFRKDLKDGILKRGLTEQTEFSYLTV